MSGFADQVDIAATLVEPKDHGEEINAKVEEIGGLLGTIEDVWQWFFGWSLLEYLFVPLSGDWGQLRSLSEGWEALGNAADGVSVNLAGITAELGQNWQGEASDSFAAYMAKWNESLANEKTMCEEMSSYIGDLSDNAEASFDIIVSTVNLVLDIVFLALKIANLAKALKKAGEALLKAKKAKKVIDELKSMIETVIAYIEAITNGAKESNDNQSVPSGYVATPDAIGITKQDGGKGSSGRSRAYSAD
ncbi:WXG100 family type VII secretion target [Amycolatopsis lurida]